MLSYLSHLELMILLQRAIKRAGFPIEYSKGFHPVPDISFGPPLGVGISGLSEYFDMKVTPPFIWSATRAFLTAFCRKGLSYSACRLYPRTLAYPNSFNNR